MTKFLAFFINGDAANETRGAYTFLYVGEDEVSYIYTPTPELPVLGTLSEAKLSVWYYYFDKIKSGYLSATAHQVDGMTWAEGSLTWNAAINYLDEGESEERFGLKPEQLGGRITMSGSIGAYKETPVKAQFNVTAAVADWINNSGTNYGVGSNYGIGLKYDKNNSTNRSVRLHSTESTASYRPQMTYQYNAVDSDHEHIYTATNQPTTTTHPHKTMWECECGATKNTYPLLAMCSECRANERIATETVCYTKVFYYIDGDAGLGTIVPAPIECYITYTNYYDYPVSMVYNYPSFVTFGSIVDSYTPGSSIYPPVNCISSKVVTYYSSLDVELWQQTMQWNSDNNAIPYNTSIAYTLNKKPGYIVTGATFAMTTGGTSYNIDITTYFE